MTTPNPPQPTGQHVSASPLPYEAPALLPLGTWTALTLNISIPVGLNNVYNSSSFDTEF